MPKASIIIPTIGRKNLNNCLKSIKDQSFDDFEVIVVGINKETEKVVSKFKKTKFLKSDIANASFQKNIGIKKSKGDILVFIDDDATADQDWLKEILKHYEKKSEIESKGKSRNKKSTGENKKGKKNKKIECVGGKIKLKLPKKIPKTLKELPSDFFHGFLGKTLLKSEKPIFLDKALLWGSNLSFKKNALIDIGCFDEKLGRTPNNLISEEERKAQIGILKRGSKILYEPNAIVTHVIEEERLTKSYFIRRSFWQGYSEILRIRNSKNFKKLLKVNGFYGDLLNHLSSTKFFELYFDSFGSSNLKERMDNVRKLGRIAAYLNLRRREKIE